MKWWWLLVLWMVSSPAFAQRTWVVDWQSGPGADFSDIQPAVDAASVGDTVLVRANTLIPAYGDVSITKGINIIGEGGNWGVVPSLPGVWVSGLEVRDLPANETVTISGVGLSFWYFPTSLIQDCAGPVMLDGVELSCGGSSPQETWALVRSSNVTISRSRLQSCTRMPLTTVGLSRIENSSVIIRDSLLESSGFSVAHLIDSDVVFVDAEVGSTGLALSGGGRIWFAGTTIYRGGGYCVGATSGTVEMRIGPAVTGITPGTWRCANLVSEDVAYVDVQPSGLVRGSGTVIEVHGSPGATALLFAGVALGGAGIVPGLGEVWIDTASPVESIGTYVLDGSGTALVTGVQVPAALSVGTSFGLQAIAIDGGVVTTTLPMFAFVQ